MQKNTTSQKSLERKWSSDKAINENFNKSNQHFHIFNEKKEILKKQCDETRSPIDELKPFVIAFKKKATSVLVDNLVDTVDIVVPRQQGWC